MSVLETEGIGQLMVLQMMTSLKGLEYKVNVGETGPVPIDKFQVMNLSLFKSLLLKLLVKKNCIYIHQKHSYNVSPTLTLFSQNFNEVSIYKSMNCPILLRFPSRSLFCCSPTESEFSHLPNSPAGKRVHVNSIMSYLWISVWSMLDIIKMLTARHSIRGRVP